MTPAIVAFCGLATCGKTSLALGLVKHRNFHRISFADPIREMLRGLGLTTAQMSEGKNDPLAMFGAFLKMAYNVKVLPSGGALYHQFLIEIQNLII